MEIVHAAREAGLSTIEKGLQLWNVGAGMPLDALKKDLGQDIVVNKLGCVLKTKASGEVKVRLVTDLRRSGGNGRLKIRERVVLPRVLDLVFSILRLLEVWEDVSFLDLVAIDFTDAFHTLWLHELSLIHI